MPRAGGADKVKYVIQEVSGMLIMPLQTTKPKRAISADPRDPDQQPPDDRKPESHDEEVSDGS
jgi:hypothetical protein